MRRAALAVIAATIAVAACAGDDAADTTTLPRPTTEPSTTPAPTTASTSTTDAATTSTSASTTDAATTTDAPSTTSPTVTTAPGTTDEDAVRAAIQAYEDAFTECFRAPEECDPTTFTAPGSHIQNGLQDRVASAVVQGQYFGPEDVGTIDIRTVDIDGDSAVAVVCVWDTTVVYERQPDGSAQVINDLQASYLNESTLALINGNWLTSSQLQIGEFVGDPTCGA